jgi:hypothetical protein
LDNLFEPLLYSLFTMPGNDFSPRRMSTLGRFRRLNRYQQAALVYLAYGLVYLAGAVYLASIGRATRGSPLLWFAVGSLIVILFPALIWRGYKWVTRILSILLGIRVLGLLKLLATGSPASVPIPGGLEIPERAGIFLFLLVAVAACVATARAGWRRPVASPTGPTQTSPPPPPA